ncbi:hypothetical protein ACH4MA_03815 [Streptomyces roseolus]|uniref:hypothetical protein n=1 Tax=Streptomyces roseolus TaxID=67358 RepID=UPI0037BAE6E4
MNPEVSRRAALLTAVSGALAVSALHTGTAQAAAPLPEAPAGKPFVTDPRQAGALYDSGAARTAHAEPLNAAVGCAAEHGGRN